MTHYPKALLLLQELFNAHQVIIATQYFPAYPFLYYSNTMLNSGEKMVDSTNSFMSLDRCLIAKVEKVAKVGNV